MEEARPMTVSAVIPTFNRLGYIRRAIDSALAQTVPVDEVLVIDDGSTDGTADVLEAEYGTRVRVIRQGNAGVSGARRRGVQEARGEWIAFLDSDDEWTRNHNEELLAAAGRVPQDVAWIFGDLRLVTDGGNEGTLFETYGRSLTESPQVFADSLSVLNPIACFFQASLIRRRVLLELECFSAGLRSDDDLLTGYQVACQYRFAAIPIVVCNYYRTADLTESSVMVRGSRGPDHFRSRMISYALVIESGRRGPWNKLYADEVRGLCRVLAHRGLPVPRSLALQQFRFGAVSAKGIAFFCAAMFGRRGIQLWNRMAESRTGFLTAPPPLLGMRKSLDGSVPSISEGKPLAEGTKGTDFDDFR
jgi:glycosyltransferase involved in cell wall biosynthesis